jgi:hypothetical protein
MTCIYTPGYNDSNKARGHAMAEDDAIFGQLIKTSWTRYEEYTRNREMDDVFVGAVITAEVAAGGMLLDLQSDGDNHYLRFERHESGERTYFQLGHITRDLLQARVLGHYTRVVAGYGERVRNATAYVSGFRREISSDFIDQNEPGIVVFDAEVDEGYVYAEVLLYLDLDPYFAGGYQVDYARLQRDLGALRRSLSKMLHGRVGA